ncbi:MAG: hypothetical protein LH472_06395 [Pyrinomonadaceae bacterium]|nr:hypothetical protein [Pyrinomonadaceae bacterium]
MKTFNLSVLLIFCFFTVSIFAQKMKPEEILAKHLDSIGTADARAAAKSLIAVGDAQVKSITKITTPVVGRLIIASAGQKIFWGMNLNSTDYPSEKFSYDGKNAKVGLVKLGTRSTLGNFVQSNNLMLEQGLFGGTLSTAWTMLDVANRKGKLSAEGTKKIDGKEAYVLSYSPKGGGDVDIKLYFDKETFRHVRTEYKLISSAVIGARPEDSTRYSENRISLTEDFADFKLVGKLTLPHSYYISYATTGTSSGTTGIEWTFNLTEFAANQNLSDGTFDIDAKQ